MARELMSRNGLHVQRGNPERGGAPGILLRENTRSVDLNVAAYSPEALEKKSCCWCWRNGLLRMQMSRYQGWKWRTLYLLYAQRKRTEKKIENYFKAWRLQKSVKEFWQVCTFLWHVWWSIKRSVISVQGSQVASFTSAGLFSPPMCSNVEKKKSENCCNSCFCCCCWCSLFWSNIWMWKLQNVNNPAFSGLSYKTRRATKQTRLLSIFMFAFSEKDVYVFGKDCFWYLCVDIWSSCCIVDSNIVENLLQEFHCKICDVYSKYTCVCKNV